jgi:hypothetical protein
VTWTTDLLGGLAQLLEDAGIAQWQTTGAYGSGQPPIFVGVQPESPDDCFTITATGATDTVLGDEELRVQLRARGGIGDTLAPLRMLDQARDVWHMIRGQSVGGIHVARLLRVSMGPLGTDANQRTEYTSNYLVYATRPSGNPWE